MKASDISKQKRGITRFLRKLIMTFACGSRLLPSKSVRPRLVRMAGVNIKEPSTVFIGDGVRFDDISPELITIGKNARITAGVCILNHFLDVGHIPTAERPFQFLNGRVLIGDNVFIGINAIICKPVTIGNNAVIGAGAVVTRDVPDGAIVAGIPAKQIGDITLVQ